VTFLTHRGQRQSSLLGVINRQVHHVRTKVPNKVVRHQVRKPLPYIDLRLCLCKGSLGPFHPHERTSPTDSAAVPAGVANLSGGSGRKEELEQNKGDASIFQGKQRGRIYFPGGN